MSFISAQQHFRILTINPGSTSTKMGLFDGEEWVFIHDLRHSIEDLAVFERVTDQLDYREELIRQVLSRERINAASLDALVCRGGRLRPVPSGVYAVNGAMLHDARIGFQGEHASNLGCLIGANLAKGSNVPVYVVDPVSVDEMWPVARISGIPEIQRASLSHALNMKAVAKKAAKRLGKTYEQSRLIVAHLGGGGSVSVHVGGKMVDLYNSDQEGPMAIERSGGIPSIELVNICFSGMSKGQVLKKLAGEGGLFAYLRTKDLGKAERLAASGNKQAALILDAYCYQVAKYVGAMATCLDGRVDAVCITGGVANSEHILTKITKKVEYLAPILVFPGEAELEALARGAVSVLAGKKNVLIYPHGEEG